MNKIFSLMSGTRSYDKNQEVAAKQTDQQMQTEERYTASKQPRAVPEIYPLFLFFWTRTILSLLSLTEVVKIDTHLYRKRGGGCSECSGVASSSLSVIVCERV